MFCFMTRICRLKGFFVLAVFTAAATGTLAPRQGFGQNIPADPNAVSIAALQTYALADQTASVRLPAQWKVVATGVGFIQAQGPNREFAMFGVMIPAKDAAPAGISSAGITQPYATDATGKFLQSIDWMRARNGKSPVQAQFYGSVPIKAPPGFGQCSNITAILNGAMAVETDFCSLPVDKAGGYRNFFKAVGLPVAAAKQERSLMEAILASYRLNIRAIEKQRAGMSTAPAAPEPQTGGTMSSTVSAENSLLAGQLMTEEANAINAETAAAEQGEDESVNNFDRGVLRGETPIYAEGDSEPMFWVGN